MRRWLSGDTTMMNRASLDGRMSSDESEYFLTKGHLLTQAQRIWARHSLALSRFNVTLNISDVLSSACPEMAFPEGQQNAASTERTLHARCRKSIVYIDAGVFTAVFLGTTDLEGKKWKKSSYVEVERYVVL